MEREDTHGTIFRYRLIQTTYKQRMEWEDGPGSLRNIVSDVSERVVAHWIGYIDLGRYIYSDDPDGWCDFSYRIERKAKGAVAWEYHRHVDKAKYERRDRYGDYDDYVPDYAKAEPEEEWPTYQHCCYWCGAPIGDSERECAECIAREEEFNRPRCLICGYTVKEGIAICDECEQYERDEELYKRERLESFLSFQVHKGYWWHEASYFLKWDIIPWIKKRVRR